jgi:hypothetical protein
MISGFGHVHDYPGGKRSFLPGGRREAGDDNAPQTAANDPYLATIDGT